MTSRHENTPGALKMAAAMVGGAAVVVMGAWAVVVSEHTDDATVVSTGPEASLGETSTVTTAPTELETPFATPAITSTAEAG